MCEEQLIIGAQLCFFWVSLGREGGGVRKEVGDEEARNIWGLLESEEVHSCCPDLQRARDRASAATLLPSGSEAGCMRCRRATLQLLTREGLLDPRTGPRR